MKVLAVILLIIFSNNSILHAQHYLSLDTAVNEALENNPEINAARAMWMAKSKVPSQVSTLPNPVIGLKYRNASFSEFTLGQDPMTNIQTYFRQEVPFPTKLFSKGDIAREEAEAERWRADDTSRKIIANLKQQYFQWLFISKALDITRKNKDLMKTFVETAETRYEVGMGIQQDVIKAQVELSGLIERLEHLNAKKLIAKAKIKELLGRPQHDDIGMPQELELREFHLNIEELSELAGRQSSELQAVSTMVDSKREQLQLAQAQYLPDFMIEGAYMSRDGGDEELDSIWEVGVGLRVPLYFWRKEKPGFEQALLQVQSAEQTFENRTNSVQFDLKDNYISAKTAYKLIDLYENGIIPQSKISLESAVAGYQVGDVDFLTLLNSQITLFNFEIEQERQIMLYRTALARIEQITAQDLILQRDGKEVER